MDQTRYPMNLWFLAFLAAGAVLPQVMGERALESDAGPASVAASLSVPRTALPVPSTAKATGAVQHEHGGRETG